MHTFPAQSTVLDEAALRNHLVGDYDLEEPVECRFLSRGDADIYRVRSRGPVCYLKIYRPPRTEAEVEAEALLTRELARAGLPVIRAIPRRDGRHAWTVRAAEGPRPLFLLQEAPGVPMSPEAPEQCQALGRLVARLHEAADGLPAPPSLPRWEAARLFQARLLPVRQFLADETTWARILELGQSVQGVLADLPTHPPAFGICHGDLVWSNVHRDREGHLMLIDLGDACYTWRAYELAVCHWALRRRLQEPGSTPRAWQALLRGYQEVRPLPEGLESRRPALELCRQLLFLGGNCDSLPARRGTEPFEGSFLPSGIAMAEELAGEAGL